jgi:hypothetical protein
MSKDQMPKYKAGHIIQQKHIDFFAQRLGVTSISGTKVSFSPKRNFTVGKALTEATAKTLNKAFVSPGTVNWISGDCPYPPNPNCLHCSAAIDPFGNIWHHC